MTREEAIKILSYRDANGVPCGYAGGITEALEMAIKALEQEPSGVFDEYGNYKYPSDVELTEPNTATSMPSGDLISRQAVYEMLDSMLDDSSDNKRNQLVSLDSIADEIAELPPVKQEPKTGHWIESNIPNEKYVCSECGGACWYYDYQGDVAKSRYCPNCGTKMESEDKECGSQY